MLEITEEDGQCAKEWSRLKFINHCQQHLDFLNYRILPAMFPKYCFNEIYRRTTFHTCTFCDWLGVAIILHNKHFKQPTCLCSIQNYLSIFQAVLPHISSASCSQLRHCLYKPPRSCARYVFITHLKTYKVYCSRFVPSFMKTVQVCQNVLKCFKCKVERNLGTTATRTDLSTDIFIETGETNCNKFDSQLFASQWRSLWARQLNWQALFWRSGDRTSWYILTIKPTRCNNFSIFFLGGGIKLYMFRTVPVPIIWSFSLYKQQSYTVCHTGLLTACEQDVNKPVWHITLLFVQWKTSDDGHRNCLKHVEFHFQKEIW